MCSDNEIKRQVETIIVGTKVGYSKKNTVTPPQIKLYIKNK